jgi:FAD/FMN-containing dehydrogenase
MKWAAQNSIPLTPRGSGSSMAGGAIGKGVIVDLSRMDTIGSIDVARQRVEVGPGSIRADVNAAAMKVGLRFPVDPSSGKFCTIGGMVSTNASGAHSLGFGSIRQWVTALDVVFSDGARARLIRGSPPVQVPAISRFASDVHPKIADRRKKIAAAHERVRKESSGYGLRSYLESGDIIDLLVGSEGTLAIVVGVELALAPVAGATGSVLGAFSWLNNAVAAATKARDAGAVACELLDRTFLDVAREGAALSIEGIPDGTEAALLAEIEGDTPEQVQEKSKRLAEEFRRAGAAYVSVALTPLEQNEIWELRHAASPILARLDPGLKSMQFIEDGAVPPDRLADYVKGVRATLASHSVRGVIFGHAGDAHVHVNPLVDMSVPDWRKKVEGMLEDVVTLTARLSGTLSGEHGDGRLRAPLLGEVWPEEEVKLFEMVKRCFDPDGILNPGVKISVAGQRPIEDVKYDSTLPSLLSEARIALDRVAEDRAYSTFRLSLIGSPE